MRAQQTSTAYLKSAVEAAIFAASIQDVQVVSALDTQAGVTLDCSSYSQLLLSIQENARKVVLYIEGVDCDRTEITLQQSECGVFAWVSGGDCRAAPANYIVAVVIGFQHQAQKFNVSPITVSTLMLEGGIYPEEAAEVAAWRRHQAVGRAVSA